MPWIESHTVLLRHPKLIELAREARLKPVYVLGHLHSLWHTAIEQREDGDLSSWSEDFIAEACAYRGDAHQWVSLLQKHGWLDGRLIHDWLDYAGPYLMGRYGGGSNLSGREKLIKVWALHGREYGRECLASKQRVISERKASLTLPYLTIPSGITSPAVTETTASVTRVRKVTPTEGEVDRSKCENNDVRMPFGEYRGVRIMDMPAERCRWLLGRWSGRGVFKANVLAALQARVAVKDEETRR